MEEEAAQAIQGTKLELSSDQLVAPKKQSPTLEEASPSSIPAVLIVTDPENPPVQLVTPKKPTLASNEASPAAAPAFPEDIEPGSPPTVTSKEQAATPTEASLAPAPAISEEIELEYPPVLPVTPEKGSPAAASIIPKEIELECPFVLPVTPEKDTTLAIPKEIVFECSVVQSMTPKKKSETEGMEAPAIPMEDELECPSIQPITPSKEIAATEIVEPDFSEETDPFCSDNMFEEESALDTECLTTSLADSFLNDISPIKDTERLPVDHGYVKSDKKKVIVKFNPPPYELDVTSMDVPDYDTEEDRADYLISKAFLKHEKTRSEELTEVLQELTDILKRHQLYAKHLISPHNLRPKRRKVEKDQLGKA